jgi:undecaprenyl-diphosphatase
MFIPALTVSLWQQVEEWDKSLFLVINRKLANPFFDAVLPYLRDSVFWIPLYLFIGAFVILNWGKKGAWWGLCFIATVAIADFLGNHGFKETVQRLRPCNEPLLQESVRLVIKKCGSGFSFISNHAANHFGLATFMVLTFRSVFKHWIYFAYLWAAAISFAQVYVGIHYPLDILGGAGFGTLTGYLTASVYHHNFGKLNLLT